MGYWLIMLSIDAALGGYVAHLWAHHGHVALLQEPPHGLHGQGFLIYAAAVVVLISLSVWVLLGDARPAVQVWILVLDGLAAAVYQVGPLSHLQRDFVASLLPLTVLTNFILFANVPFWLGGLFEGRGSARSLEVDR